MSNKQYLTWNETCKIYAKNIAPIFPTFSELISELNRRQLKVKFDYLGNKLEGNWYLGHDGVGFFLQEK